MSLFPTLIFSFVFLLILVRAESGDYETYQTRPELRPPKLTVSVNEDAVEPGYILMAPFKLDNGQNTAMIYDTSGNVIWTGFGLSGGSTVYDFRLCIYNDAPHFCYLNGKQEGGFSRGHMEILDLTFSLVKQIRPQDGKAPNDQHETNLSYDKKSALITIYNIERADLSTLGIGGQGWVQNTMFQRINIETGELEFEWSPLGRIPFSDSFVPPSLFTDIVSGHSRQSPYDWLHLNAIDENSDGDYYLSARHTNALYKISGTNGSILWQLGGRRSDFEFVDDLTFSSQHHVRIISHNQSAEVLSIFDNASDGIRMTAEQSRGMILKLDHTTTPPSAALLKSFEPPSQAISDSQGSLQIYNPTNWENSHALVCWGSQPSVDEYDANGNIIFSARIQYAGAATYRGYKFDFDTDPFDRPALYSYARNFDSSTIYYMSWNGATRIRAWRIYGKSICDDRDDWKLVDESTPKTGFETMFVASGKFYDYTMVEALDANGEGLKNSSILGTKTFVPGEWLAAQCDEFECPPANETYVFDVPQVSLSDDVRRMQRCRPHGW